MEFLLLEPDCCTLWALAMAAMNHRHTVRICSLQHFFGGEESHVEVSEARPVFSLPSKILNQFDRHNCKRQISAILIGNVCSYLTKI